MKVAHVEDIDKKDFDEQMVLWMKFCLESENIVALMEHFYDNSSNAYMVMEYCEGGDLETLIKKKKKEKERFTEHEITKIARSVLIGLSTLHRMKVIHRDIKTANILLTNDHKVKLADFDVSRMLAEGVTTTLKGTIHYIAPEVFSGDGYTFSADAYSVGAVLYELVTLTNVDLKRVLANQPALIDPSLNYSSGLIGLIRSLLALNPTERPSVEGALAHISLVGALQKESVEQQWVIESLRKETVEQRTRLDEQQGVILALRQENANQKILNTVQQKTIVEMQQDLSATRVQVAELTKDVALLRELFKDHCSECLETKPVREVIRCTSGHFICQNCLRKQARRILNGKGGPRLLCHGGSEDNPCTGVFDRHDVQKILNAEQYGELVQRFPDFDKLG